GRLSAVINLRPDPRLIVDADPIYIDEGLVAEPEGRCSSNPDLRAGPDISAETVEGHAWLPGSDQVLNRSHRRDPDDLIRMQTTCIIPDGSHPCAAGCASHHHLIEGQGLGLKGEIGAALLPPIHRNNRGFAPEADSYDLDRIGARGHIDEGIEPRALREGSD